MSPRGRKLPWQLGEWRDGGRPLEDCHPHPRPLYQPPSSDNSKTDAMPHEGLSSALSGSQSVGAAEGSHSPPCHG